MFNEFSNKENITVICFDPHHELNYFQKRLNQINGNIIFHIELQHCLASIHSIENQNVFLIIPSSSQAISHFIDLDKIHSIFIFDTNHGYEFIEDPKVIGIYDDIISLCSGIQEQIHFIRKPNSKWCFFDQNEYLTTDLSKQTSNFLWLQLLRKILPQLSHDEQAKNQLFETCRYYYQNNHEELEFINEFEQNYHSKQAIYWFLKCSFLQKMINKALQTENTILLYSLRYFLIDLLENLTDKYQQNILMDQEKIIIYQKMLLTNDEFQQLQENQDKLMSMKEFIITNTNRPLELSEKQTNSIPVLFEFECNKKQIDITQLNELVADQGTILLDFNSTFRLETIEQNEQRWTIKLIEINDNHSILKKYIDDTHRQIDNLSFPILFGKLIFDMNQWKQSQLYFEYLLKDSTNEDQAWIEHSLGHIHYSKGEWKEARQYYDHAYNRMMENEPSRIKDSAIVLSDISDLLRRKGKFEKASEFDQQAAAIRTKYYDPKHIHMTYNLTYIGLDYFRQRKYDEALLVFQDVLKIREEYYKCMHIDIAKSLNLIGHVLNNQQKYNEALTYCRKALVIYEKYYPSGNIHIASTMNSIGLTLASINSYNEALDNVERALVIQKRFYPFGHIDIANSLYTIGYIKQWQAKYDESLELFQKVLIMQQKHLFPNHLDIVRTLNALGILQSTRKGNYDIALDYHRQALTMLNTDYPSYIGKIALTLRLIADVLRKQMKIDEALDSYYQILKMQENYYSSDHYDMVSVLSNIGDILGNQGKYATALDYHRRALKFCETYYSPDHMSIVLSLRSMGNIKLKQRSLNDALDYYQRALSRLEQYHSTNFIQIRYCLGVIADILNRKLLLIRSIEYLKRCLRITEANYSAEHEYVIRILSNLGATYKNCHQYELSLVYEMKCFSIREKVLPPNHQDIGNSLVNIGHCYEQLNQIKTAYEYYKQALIIYEQCLPANHIARQKVHLKVEQLRTTLEKIDI